MEVRLELGDVPGAAILEDRFRQVLLNLAINAVDAMSGKGRMTVRTWLQEGWNPGSGQALRRRATDPLGMDGVPLRAAGAGEGRGVALSVTDTGGGIVNEAGLEIPKVLAWKKEHGTVVGFPGSRTISNADRIG